MSKEINKILAKASEEENIIMSVGSQRIGLEDPTTIDSFNIVREVAPTIPVIECRGFAAMVEAADAMVKAAKVELVSMQKTGGGYVTAVVRGDVAAVKAAVDAGIRGAEKVGEVVATHVIARPHNNVDTVLPLGRQDQVTQGDS